MPCLRPWQPKAFRRAIGWPRFCPTARRRNISTPISVFSSGYSKRKKEGHRITLQPGDQWLGDLLRHYAGQAVKASISPQDPALLLFTGGTTGSAKAALGTRRSLYIAAAQLHAYEDIRAFCKERRVGYKVPRYVGFRATLPKTMVGKVLRRELKAEKQ